MRSRTNIKEIFDIHYEDLKHANRIKSFSNKDFIITPISVHNFMLTTGEAIGIKFREYNKKTETMTRKVIFVTVSQPLELIDEYS